MKEVLNMWIEQLSTQVRPINCYSGSKSRFPITLLFHATAFVSAYQWEHFHELFIVVKWLTTQR